MSASIDVVIVGAGSAGLATSYLLSRAGIAHVVLERGEIGQSWRTQRWDSFTLNTPNWCNGLIGMDFHPEAPDAFVDCDALIRYFEGYAGSFELPVRTHTNVTSVRRRGDERYTIRTDDEEIVSRAVVLASGGMNRPRLPRISECLADSLTVCTAGTYRSPDAVPEGAVVVVGSGQSGCQIVEDLLEAGRRVFLSVSRVARVPRSYRGRDILAWWKDMGFLDTRVEELKNPSLQFSAQPQVSGRHGGHTVSLQSLARDGASLIGRVEDADGTVLRLGRTVNECMAFADEKSNAFKADIDKYIEQAGLKVEPASPDPGEPTLPDLKGSDSWQQLDLRSEDVRSLIWCTGFDADWGWVEVDVFDDAGRPVHKDGLSRSKGLYFVGLPWLSSRKSGILCGVSDDAARIVQDIERNVLAGQAG
jgi:putative flavoprotein involved in K+ transport